MMMMMMMIMIMIMIVDHHHHHHHHDEEEEEEEELPANPSKSLGFEETSHQILSAQHWVVRLQPWEKRDRFGITNELRGPALPTQSICRVYWLYHLS